MSFRGRGGGGGRSFGGGGRGGGGRPSFGGGGRGGRGGGGRNFDQGPPERVIPLGYFDYSVQDDLVCKVEIEDVPYFNAPIYLENKEQVGKIDEIFGNIRDYSVTIRLGEDMKASSFKKSQKVIIISKMNKFDDCEVNKERIFEASYEQRKIRKKSWRLDWGSPIDQISVWFLTFLILLYSHNH